jgi:hypothetical protein
VSFLHVRLLACLPPLLLGACARSPSGAVSASPAPVSAVRAAPSSGVSTPPQPADACASLRAIAASHEEEARAHAETILAAAYRDHKEPAHDPADTSPPVTTPKIDPPAPIDCDADSAGAWAVLPELVELVPDGDDWGGTWNRNATVVLARADTHGHITTAKLETFQTRSTTDDHGPFVLPGERNCCFSPFGGGVTKLFRGDVDGDGIPEVALGASDSHEGTTNSWSALFRAEPGGPRVLGTGFDSVHDEDGDGHPDLVYRPTFEAGASCGSGFPQEENAPATVAHNDGHGTFSKSDGWARDQARNWCAHEPRTFRTVNDVVCASMWGKAARARAKAYIERNFVPLDCKAELAGRKQPNPRASDDHDRLLGALTIEPPFLW